MQCSYRIANAIQQGDISTSLCKGSLHSALIKDLQRVLHVPMITKINRYAEQADVLIHVTSSFRTSSNVASDIVKPAIRSKHRTGHALDRNVVYDNKQQFANSKVLAQYTKVPNPVRQFIKFIIDDLGLRWGGTFSDRDQVHIDDHLNRDSGRWDHRYLAIQRTVLLGEE